MRISPCCNYLLTATKQVNEELPFVTVVEISTGKTVACSQVLAPIQDIKWDTVSKGTLEFQVISKQNVFFWRLNKRNALEYIQYDLNSQQLSAAGNLHCLEHAEMRDMNCLLVGTHTGTVLVFNLQTGSLVCLCRGILKGPITKMIYSMERLVMFSNTVNIYQWHFADIFNAMMVEHDLYTNQYIEFENFIISIEEKPLVITIDSVSSLVSQNYPHQPQEQILVISRSGVLWLIDFPDKISLRLSASHVTGTYINSIGYVPNRA